MSKKWSRRDALYILGAGVASGVVFSGFGITGARAVPRPPGSLVEEEFLKFCARCHQCIEACPVNALHPAGFSDGMVNWGTPVLDFKKCIFCMECIRICPTNAIQKIPEEEIDIGNARINRETCLPWSGQRRCNNCLRACRYNAIEMVDGNPVVIEENCNGCARCEARCPTDPKSIVIFYEKYTRSEQPGKRVTVKLENRTEPLRFPPPDFKTWFVERIRQLARYHGLID
ncbi:MAG: 4Fe-4S dicluster domain-containing protein [Syntrophales bacterium]|jgi:ferredoxin|nr:4Fe-4S dicluster domain-containing protein [Syntrophales bacterium]MCK9528549.1 4Fe-4S dicluster domain-containing protein [Syntrophales bacterium]MDX9922824.1 4Fe-4S dicluster domain-containing protein [Syntrophales bacterium]